jgi:hypothetical protein
MRLSVFGKSSGLSSPVAVFLLARFCLRLPFAAALAAFIYQRRHAFVPPSLLHPLTITHPSSNLITNSDSFRCLLATLVILITSTPSLL